MASIRETVLSWDPFTEPTIEQYDVAKLWLEMSNNKPAVSAFDAAKIKELIRRFEYSHPEVFPRNSGTDWMLPSWSDALIEEYIEKAPSVGMKVIMRGYLELRFELQQLNK